MHTDRRRSQTVRYDMPGMTHIVTLCITLCVCTLCLFTTSCRSENIPDGTETQPGTGLIEPIDTNMTEPTGAATIPETEPDIEPDTEPEAPFLSCMTPTEGETVSLLNDMMTKWVSRYRRGNLDSIWKIEERCEPVGVTLTWSCQGDPLYYHVFVADNPHFDNAAVYLAASPSLFLGHLFVGTDYCWRVEATMENPDKPGEPGETVSSEAWHFSTMMTPRTVAVEGVSNLRDVGGYTTADGRYRVKQGMVYRGAEADRITETGKRDMLFRLGIKTELDLRGTTLARSVLGDTVKYVAVNAPHYTQVLSAEYQKAVTDELRVFADPDNYPIYFHCALGRDRTGTLAFMLGCILNVKQEDAFMDYEVSFFSDYGGYTDTNLPSTMVSGLTTFAAKLKTHTAKPQLHDAMTAYLLELGMSQAELDAIRANLLEPIPDAAATEKEGN